jgi:hypothetical protein
MSWEEESRLKEFENRVLWGIFGPKRGKIIQGCRKAQNVFSSSNIIIMIKSRTMRYGRHITRMGRKIKAFKVLN